MLQTTDAKEAATKYKLICQQMLAVAIPIKGTAKLLKLKGTINPVDNTKDKTVSEFTVDPKTSTDDYPLVSVIIQKADTFYKIFIQVETLGY